MNDSQPPKDLLEAMAEPATGEAGEPVLPFDREARLQAWLRAQVADLPARQRRRRRARHLITASTLAAAAAAAAAAFVVLSAPQPGQPSSTVADGERVWQAQLTEGAQLTWLDARGRRHALSQGGALPAPGQVSVDARPARLTSPDGVELQLAPGTRLRTPARVRDERRSEVELQRGEVEVQVPPLGARRSFAVRTHDTEVIVHGTRFRVTVNDAGTCVRVSEGRVEVRGTTGIRFLGAGDSHGCTRAPETGAEPERASDRADVRAGGGAGGQKAAGPVARPARRARPAPSARETRETDPEAAASAPDQGTLPEQNQLLSRALGAERDGEIDAAERAFRQLLKQHPDSPLAPEARRGLQRLER